MSTLFVVVQVVIASVDDGGKGRRAVTDTRTRCKQIKAAWRQELKEVHKGAESGFFAVMRLEDSKRRVKVRPNSKSRQ